MGQDDHIRFTEQAANSAVSTESSARRGRGLSGKIDDSRVGLGRTYTIRRLLRRGLEVFSK